MKNLDLDAIIVADVGSDSFSGTNPLKLMIEDKTADIQTIQNYLCNNGKIVQPIKDDGVYNWASTLKLNGIYLYNYLQKHNFNVALIDKFYDETEEFHKLLSHSPKIIILSTTFINSKHVFSTLVGDIRKLASDIKIIAGGPFVYHSYLMYRKLKVPDFFSDLASDEFLFLEENKEPAVDYYIVSLRGEEILCELISNIKSNRSTTSLPNLAYFDKNTYHFSQRIDDISNSSFFPIDWESLPESFFKSGVVPLQASVGCPYNCAFCNFTKDRRLTYVKPLDQLIQEMKSVSHKGAKYIWFVDDNFRLGKNDLENICHRFIQEKLDLKWMTFIRANTLRDTDAKLLKQAGCIEVQLGLESADPQILKNMNKEADIELYDIVLQKLLSEGINCSCYFILGFPGETEKTAQRTLEFIKKHSDTETEGTLSWSIFPFHSVPLSPIYEPTNRKKFGLSGSMKKWRHDTMNSEQAGLLLIKTFLELENSGPIYRGDNQVLLGSLEPTKRRKFHSTRHRLSKMSIKNELTKKDIIDSFSDILDN